MHYCSLFDFRIFTVSVWHKIQYRPSIKKDQDTLLCMRMFSMNVETLMNASDKVNPRDIQNLLKVKTVLNHRCQSSIDRVMTNWAAVKFQPLSFRLC